MSVALRRLEVRALECRFADPPAQALTGVSLTVDAGELVAIMGESGAGKSTLLRCVNGLVPSLVPAACEGEILLDGAGVLGVPVGMLAGRVAMVFQDFEAQLFSTNVRLEVAFGPAQLGVAPYEIERRVAAALARVGLTDLVARDPRALSGGQKQRLAIASILAMAPAVILFDEAATDLDPVGRQELYATLQRLRTEGLALVAVEHEIDPVLGADRLYLMRAGAIVASGPPAVLACDVDAFLACGVRPHDLAVLARRLDVELPLAVEDAVEALRRLGVSRLLPATKDAASRRPAAADGPPILEVEHLSYRYADGPGAVHDVSVAIGAGEVIALIGRNGSGKTTLAKHLNGLLRATSGTVRLDGADVATVPLDRVAQQVGYVFQNPDDQLFAATVADEIAFGPRNFGLAGDVLTTRVEEVLAAVGLAERRDADPFLLSKGERQRLAVATVLAMAPRVLILDEPTTGLDYPQQRQMLELLVRLRARGTTIVLATHSPWVVAEYAERVLLMHAGRLVFDGPLATFVADATLLQAAAFEPPPAMRLGLAFGRVTRTVDELVAALDLPTRLR
ncbi:MAG: energy-coupling factor ABC transporter ATP-binding protein [Deltaproteobacteria bacterium]|nr:energy-coupling factor ABC transporter ATP-binding protein [Deltaproteobacteria bacterium]